MAMLNGDDDFAASNSHAGEDSTFTGELLEEERGPGENNKRQQRRRESQTIIAKDETKAVRGLKVLFFAVILLSMGGVAYAAYYFTKANEMNNFETQFRDDANKVFSGLGASLDVTLGAIDVFTISLVSYARNTNQTWPFVTVPDFAVRAQKIRHLSNSVFMNVYPLVAHEQRKEWEQYAEDNNQWVEEGIAFQSADETYKGPIITNYTTFNVIHDYVEFDGEVGTTRDGPYMPIWQSVPVIPIEPPYNWDLMSAVQNQSIVSVWETHKVTLSEVYLIAFPDDEELIAENEEEAEWISSYLDPGEEPMEPISDIYYPIIEDMVDAVSIYNSSYNPADHKLAGFVSVSLYWRDLIKNILPKGSDGIDIVFENECTPSFTYRFSGPNVTFLGAGAIYDEQYEYLEQSSWLRDLHIFTSGARSYTGIPVNENFCPFFVRIFPSDTMYRGYATRNPINFAGGILLVFAFTWAVFLVYDFCVERRQRKVMSTAVVSSAIVSELFPSVVRDRVKASTATKADKKEATEGASDDNRQIIAEEYQGCTVCFADVKGFTAWSAVREPSQVFTLLETIYAAFDDNANKRGVFKVETIGDCYVAVCGLPEPRRETSVVMARFANECRTSFNCLTRELSLTLGPGTEDLLVRIGLHSGPVTAGVLRGERSRFQIFGDTVNTTARMESTGSGNRIHVSQKTADALIAAGKKHWLVPREELVHAKGKGEMQTYWVEPRRGKRTNSVSSGHESTESSSSPDIALETEEVFCPKVMDASGEHYVRLRSQTLRLVDWNVTLFEELLKNIRARQNAVERRQVQNKKANWSELNVSMATAIIRGELEEAYITLPEFNDPTEVADNSETVELSAAAVGQLRDFIGTIAHSYRSNPFHGFDHACHVLMIGKKLVHRIATSEVVAGCGANSKSIKNALHDPLVQFSVLFAALIHNIDHQGVPDSVLLEEKAPVAVRFENRCISQLNAIEIAFTILMDDKFTDLRSCICSSQEDLQQFRGLVIRAVLATDLSDAKLMEHRESQWRKAFLEVDGYSPESTNVMVTITIEYILQASSVAHYMQNWWVFQKWTKRLFEEEYDAYWSGRCETDPSEKWYDRELHCFDTCVIPLAEKLKECGLFGATAGAEFLELARGNRKEWETQGREVVAGLSKELQNGNKKSNAKDDSASLVVHKTSAGIVRLRDDPNTTANTVDPASEISA